MKSSNLGTDFQKKNIAKADIMSSVRSVRWLAPICSPNLGALHVVSTPLGEAARRSDAAAGQRAPPGPGRRWLCLLVLAHKTLGAFCHVITLDQLPVGSLPITLHPLWKFCSPRKLTRPAQNSFFGRGQVDTSASSPFEITLKTT